jgi:hypothetical protein
MQKTSRKPPSRRRTRPPAAPPAAPPPPDPAPGAPSTLRVFLDALRSPGPSARTVMELITRIAFWAVGLGGVISLFGGSAGVPVTDKIVDLLWRLVLLGVIDQWAVVPLLRALGKLGALWLARRRRGG